MDGEGERDVSVGRSIRVLAMSIVLAPSSFAAGNPALDESGVPPLTPVYTQTFSAPLALSNAWADVDNDGDPDLAVTFENGEVRLYRNNPDGFRNVGAEWGLLTDPGDPRSIAWGDFDNDGDLDLYVGYSGHVPPANRLYRNELDKGQERFTEIGKEAGANVQGLSRQASFVDFDGDGDLDLFVALRDDANLLLKNDGGRFADVSYDIGLYEPRRTVGACWFDMENDGDLDLFTANQNGDRDGMFRNDRGRFVDIAGSLDIDQPRRSVEEGSVGCAPIDFDNDGDLDLHVASYGPDKLYRNDGGAFTDVAETLGIAVREHMVSAAWGDVQHDGRLDVYVVGFEWGKPRYPDHFFISNGNLFIDQQLPVIREHDADHGAQFADFDRDGDLDLALADSDPSGVHYLYRNDLPRDATLRSIQILVLDAQGHYTRAGAQVRVFRGGTQQLLGLRMVDTGSGYNAQNALPVHIGLAEPGLVDVRVTRVSPEGPLTQEFRDIDPALLAGKAFVVRLP